jgi:DNA replication protein DnaC
MDRIDDVLMILKQRAGSRLTTTTPNSQGLSSTYECSKCQDTEFIIDGWKARECECAAQKRYLRRVKSAMIPEEFANARFDTYKAVTPTQKTMLEGILAYLRDFEEIRFTPTNSLGFIAKYGEQRLRALKNPKERSEAKLKHNNFGLGKTHLQVAAAKELLKRGYTVLIISDVAFMEDVTNARTIDDEGEQFHKLLESAMQVDVLVWDDIGKAKPSDFRMGVYYRIIDERYRHKRPILFSSNEDMSTLTERIGDAAASRLLGMAKGRTFAVEGTDFRLQGA